MDRNLDQHTDRRKGTRLTELERTMILSLYRRRNVPPEAVALCFGIGSAAAHALRRKARAGLQEVAA